MLRFPRFLLPLGMVLPLVLLGGCSTSEAVKAPAAQLDLAEVKAGEFDTGKMWTFDYPPREYFARAYNFRPDDAWFEKARLSALRVPGCSASFISEDGLVMTNHHCARGALDAVNREGENIPELGFYAATQAEERKIPNYYADQLVLIEDVSDEVVKAFESGATDEERIARRAEAVEAIEKRYSENTGLICNVITFYNGGRYSIYGYKRYRDVRLVFAPEQAVAFFGGDPDNFTYPRYDLDVSFYRVYDDAGKPLKTSNFYRWSKTGAAEGEPVFVVGNPGRTNRLYTYAQLEFQRDVLYPATFRTIDALERIYSEQIARYPEKKARYQTRLFGLANSRKLYIGRLGGLRDPILMAKKRDFERTLKKEVLARPQLARHYAGLWTEIEQYQAERRKIFAELNAYNYRGPGRSSFFVIASELIEFAQLMKLPPEKRPQGYRENLDSVKAHIYPPAIDLDLEQDLLALQLQTMQSAFAGRNESFRQLMAGRSPKQAAAELVSSSILVGREKTMQLLNGAPDAILASTDPFVVFVLATAERALEVRERNAEIASGEQARVQMLGKAMYDVYGTSIPPDATFTLRLADGVVKGYPYNGTEAPFHTTFYGMYDRYYSFQKKAPWKLPERWIDPKPEFKKSTPFNFVSTNDIIGGNSGSPVVNRDLEIVGIAFDGNIESLPNDMIYTEEKNRCVSVHSAGILEAIEHVYGAERLARELRAGKIE